MVGEQRYPVWEPKHRVIVFGDGAVGRIANEALGDFDPETGEELVKCWIFLSEDALKHYNIEGRGLLTPEGYFVESYPKANFKILNASSQMSTVLCLNDLFGNPTDLDNEFLEASMRRNYEAKIKTLRGQIAVLQEEIRKQTTQDLAHWRGIRDKVSMARQCGGEINKQDEGEEVEGSYDGN